MEDRSASEITRLEAAKDYLERSPRLTPIGKEHVKFLIETVEQQQQEIERLKSQELVLSRSIETKDIDCEVEENEEAVCIAGKWKGYRAFWYYKGNGVYNFRYKSPDDEILHWLEDDGEYEDDSDWRIVADVIPNPIK